MQSFSNTRIMCCLSNLMRTLAASRGGRAPLCSQADPTPCASPLRLEQCSPPPELHFYPRMCLCLLLLWALRLEGGALNCVASSGKGLWALLLLLLWARRGVDWRHLQPSGRPGLGALTESLRAYGPGMSRADEEEPCAEMK